MPDKKQVMFDIERCICHVPDACRDCSKYKGVDGLRCMEELMADAYVLLKEQEAVEPISRFNKLLNETIYWCGKCEANIEKNQSYCGCCGQKVKWGG